MMPAEANLGKSWLLDPPALHPPPNEEGEGEQFGVSRTSPRNAAVVVSYPSLLCLDHLPFLGGSVEWKGARPQSFPRSRSPQAKSEEPKHKDKDPKDNWGRREEENLLNG